MKIKINCLNKKLHSDYEKTLSIIDFDLSRKIPLKIWQRCSYFNHETKEKCVWQEISINRHGGVTQRILPNKYHIDVERTAKIVVGE